MYSIVTTNSVQHGLTEEEMIGAAAYIEANTEPYALLRGDVYIYETHPDECLFCGNMKPFCICEKES